MRRPVESRHGIRTWAIGLLLFAFGDTLTSILVFQKGGAEANILYGRAFLLIEPALQNAAEVPLLGLLTRAAGTAVLAVVLVKVVAVLAVIALARSSPRMDRIASVAMVIVGGLLVANNVTVYAVHLS